jgi:hypothetical protein
MGRASKVDQLLPEQQSVVDRCIRAYRYRDLDFLLADLKEQGFVMSRSALHRYVSRLQKRDSLCASPEEGTIVTIVERGTGAVRVLKTAATGQAVAALIAGLGPATDIS